MIRLGFLEKYAKNLKGKAEAMKKMLKSRSNLSSENRFLIPGDYSLASH